MRRVLTVALSWVVAGYAVAVAQPPPLRDASPAAPPSASTIDDELLKDLLPSAEKGTKRPTTPSPADAQAAKPQSAKPQSVVARPGEDGEDLGDSPADQLRAILAPLEQAVQRLEKGDSSTVTRQQQQAVIDRFDQLLARRPRPQSAAAGAEGATGERPGGKPPTAKPDQGKEQGGGERPAGEPGELEAETKPVDAANEFWGQLPDQVREQLRNALPERFLPGYESLIEAYYRRIAERRRP